MHYYKVFGFRTSSEYPIVVFFFQRTADLDTYLMQRETEEQENMMMVMMMMMKQKYHEEDNKLNFSCNQNLITAC